jgi:hypothetical protein
MAGVVTISGAERQYREGCTDMPGVTESFRFGRNWSSDYEMQLDRWINEGGAPRKPVLERVGGLDGERSPEMP